MDWLSNYSTDQAKKRISNPISGRGKSDEWRQKRNSVIIGLDKSSLILSNNKITTQKLDEHVCKKRNKKKNT